MTDNVEQTADQGTGAPEDTQYSEVELQAMEHGWKPKDDYEGDPAKWRSAELFMELKPFYDKIEKQSRQLKQNQKSFQQIAKDVQSMKAAAYQKAVADLKAARKDAMNEGDFERAELYSDRIDQVQEQRRISEAQAAQEVQHDTGDTTELEVWISKNTWYDKDEALREWADGRGVKLHSQGMDRAEILSQLEREVKQKFPEKFANPNRARPGVVSEGGKPAAKAEKLDMSPEEARIMETILRSTGMSRDEYIKQYKAQK